MRIIFPVISLALFSILNTGCVFDDDFDNSSSDNNETKNFAFHAADNIEVNSKVAGDFDGFMTYAGDLEIDTKRIQLTRADVVSHDRDMAGFIAERPALADGNSAKAVADSLENKLGSQGAREDEQLSSLINYSVISEQTYAGLGAITKRIALSFSQALEPTPLSRSFAQLFGTLTENGTIDSWPSADSDEPSALEYSLYLTVIYLNSEQVITMASVSPSELANNYAHLLRSSTTPTNMTLIGVDTEITSESFTASGGGGLADFLFVIDDSGSMSNEQQAVKNAAEVFSETMFSSGLDFEIATITTGSEIIFRDTNQDGGFTKNLDEFKLDVTPGTSGSNTETGIFNAEQALLSQNSGDPADGIVTASGHPRSGANLSVIIISDEPSQYTSRAQSEFNPDDNLFIDREYRVYSIIETSSNSSSQYDDLSNSSGGSVANILSIEQFPEIFSEIATLAGAASSRYTLTFTPIESTIEVRVNNSLQDRSNTNGWQYIIGSNSILFKGQAIPQAEQSVDVRYTHLPTQFWWVEPVSSVDALFF